MKGSQISVTDSNNLFNVKTVRHICVYIFKKRMLIMLMDRDEKKECLHEQIFPDACTRYIYAINKWLIFHYDDRFISIFILSMPHQHTNTASLLRVRTNQPSNARDYS